MGDFYSSVTRKTLTTSSGPDFLPTCDAKLVVNPEGRLARTPDHARHDRGGRMTHHVTDRRKFRLIASLSAVAVVAAGTATVALAAKNGDPAPVSAFVRIEEVGKNVVNPKVQQGGTSG